MLRWLYLSSTEVWGKVQMSDPKDVAAEATESGSIGVDGIRLWKVIAVVRLQKVSCCGNLQLCITL